MTRRGVFPGSFDPPTVAHVEIADAALRVADLAHLDFAVARAALGKDTHWWPVEDRVAALERVAAARRGLGVVTTGGALLVDVVQGYDAVVMGADKWAQVCDPAWYGSAAARDAALTRLPHVLVVPRAGRSLDDVSSDAAVRVDVGMLEVDPALAEVSSTVVRAGRVDLLAPEVRRRLIVDAMNVIGSRPDGWWRDRDGAVRALVAALAARARRTGDRIAVVVDGRPLPDLPEGVHDGVLVAYATRPGRDAADDRIVAEVSRDRNPASLTVVTSDRALRGRIEVLGARVAPASALLPRS